eukprot:CAMPEP_0170888922 /NCGR_PEP_ID=MMETSP0734-20130129/38855_1 /TAXON_ID=186038 /ORGANISM="Fragilariopsis kerguelensis, Strain L26-C5" /LENGTH=436 /DNA_ID=CAMNT_0011276801 /DNA_START=229 /DNA_END=1538 /DNA_ORIENTATION=-
MPVFTRTRPNLSNTSTPKNDGLPFVNGKKVAVNHGRISSQRGSSKVEDNFEKFTQQNNSFDCSNRVWFFAAGIVVAICLHLSPTYSLILTKKGNSNNNDNTTTTTTATTNGSIPKTVVMNKEAVNNNEQAVPDMIDAAVTIPSPAAPETASVPVDDTVPVPSVVLPPAATTTCTAGQRELVLKQLPNTCSSGWPSHCSFRVATGGCQNPILARTFFANTNDFRPVDDFRPVASSSSSVPIPFTAVIVGWGNNNIPLDLLRIGSGLDPKYDKDWDTHLSSTKGINSKNTCRTPITTTKTKEGDPPTRLPPQVVVLDWENPSSSVLHEGLGLYDSRNTCLKPITTTIAATKEGDQPTRLPPQVVVLDWDNPTSSVLHEFNKKYHDQELIIEDTINMNRGGEYAGKKDSFTTLIQSKLMVSQQQQEQEPPPPPPSIIHY